MVRSVSCRFLHAQSTWSLEQKNRKQWSCFPLPLPPFSIQSSMGVGVADEKLCTGKM